jgi:hypothetical protein
MSYQSLLEDFIKNKQNRRYAVNIIAKLTGQHRHGPIAKIRNQGTSAMVDRIEDIITYLVNDATSKKRYTSSILPTIVSPQQAPNFWFRNEKEPTMEEVYRLLYIILTGVYQGSYIVNLDNVDVSVREDFRNWLIKKNIVIFPGNGIRGGINLKEIFNRLKIHGFPLSEFCFSLLILSYFVGWLKYKMEIPKFIQEMEDIGLPPILSKIGIEDTATLVIFNLHRQKKEMHIVPRLKDFIVKWYEEYLTGREDSIFLLSFLSSLYVKHKDYRKIIDKIMNKFIYYLLREYVNGELLVNMINIKIKYELKERKKRPYPIRKAKAFLRKI